MRGGFPVRLTRARCRIADMRSIKRNGSGSIGFRLAEEGGRLSETVPRRAAFGELDVSFPAAAYHLVRMLNLTAAAGRVWG